MSWRPDRALLTAAVVIILDQWTKWLAFSQLSPADSESILPGVSLGQTRNEGIAFGVFAGKPWIVFSLMGVALAVLLWFYVRHRGRSGLWLATGLLLGGAIGNAIDRISLGYVRDFIELPHFPSFNIADVAITFGVIVLVLTVEQHQPEETDDEPVKD
ncbi:MAG: signal peptidase II [Thermoleophilaceae bacterium]|nr:signal peptidase II [Thermoleophilaceae bacterium]